MNRIMPNDPQNFWNFSLKLYDQEDVAAACLKLQDNYQLDVNLILFCFWHAATHGQITEELMHEVIVLTQPWRSNVVQPLRSTRTWMKQNAVPGEQFEKLRGEVKTIELLAEKFQQEQIAKITSTFNKDRHCITGADDIGRNIACLLVAVQVEEDEEISKAVEIIRGAVKK